MMCKRERYRSPCICPDPRTEFCTDQCRRAFEQAVLTEKKRRMKK